MNKLRQLEPIVRSTSLMPEGDGTIMCSNWGSLGAISIQSEAKHNYAEVDFNLDSDRGFVR